MPGGFAITSLVYARKSSFALKADSPNIDFLCFYKWFNVEFYKLKKSFF